VWFAQHLSNFNFAWPWSSWASCLSLDDDAPKKIFVREVLEREVRLSYWDRIKQTVTQNFEPVMPKQPTPVFAYDKAVASAQDADYVKFAPAAVEKLRDRVNGTMLLEWLDSQVAPVVGAQGRLKLLWPCMLNNSAKSFSHVIALLDRYRELLRTLAADSGAAQAILVQGISDFWRNSPLHMVVIVDKMVTSHTLSAGPVVTWIFTQTQHPRHRQFLWEMLHNTLEKSVLRAAKAAKQNASSSNESKEVVAAGTQKELQDLFVLTFQHFQRSLSERLQTDQDEMSHAYSHLASRLVQFGRMFHKDISPFFTQITKVFADADERISYLFNISQSL